MKYCYDGLEFDSREDALDYIEDTVFKSDVVEFMLDNYSEDEIFDMLKIYERDRIKSELVDELAEDIDEEDDEDDEDDFDEEDDDGISIEITLGEDEDDSDEDEDENYDYKDYDGTEDDDDWGGGDSGSSGGDYGGLDQNTYEEFFGHF